jgi:hypothetical protein
LYVGRYARVCHSTSCCSLTYSVKQQNLWDSRFQGLKIFKGDLTSSRIWEGSFESVSCCENKLAQCKICKQNWFCVLEILILAMLLSKEIKCFLKYYQFALK